MELAQPFNPQPNEQCATVLKKMGHEADARQILIAKEEDRAKSIPLLSPARLWHFIKRITIAYGYKPWRALFWSFFLVIVSACIFHQGRESSLLRPTQKDMVTNETPDLLEVDPNYPAFNPLLYSLDEFLPIINLRISDHYLPDANRGRVLLDRTLLHQRVVVTTGTLLRWWLWIHILTGWTLTTLVVAGLTGIIRK